MVNVFDPDWDDECQEAPFAWRRARVGRQAGAERLGASVFDLAPGSSTFPMHAHFANEELLVVLEGRPTLRLGDGSRELSAGELVSFPAGWEGAHRIDNRSAERARVLIVSTMLAPEINAMLEDGSYWIRDYAPGSKRSSGSLDVRLRPELDDDSGSPS